MSKRTWLVLLGSALALRVVVVFGFLHSMPVVSDAAEYAAQGRRLAHDFPGGFAYYWPPGTSYFLAPLYFLFGDGAWVAKAGSILVDVACVALVALLAEKVVSNKRAVVAAGWLYALYPSAVLTAGQPYSFAITMLCLLIMTLALLAAHERESWGAWLVAGSAFGFAVLVRPSTITVAFALAAVVLVVARSTSGRSMARLLGGAAVFLACAIAVVLPVMAHNASQHQGWTVSTANEQNFWLGNNRYTPNYKTWHLGQHRAAEYAPEVARELRRFHVGHPSREDRRAMLRDAIDFVEAHPAVTALRTANRARAFWGFDYTASGDVQTVFQLSGVEVAPLVALEVLGYWLLALLAIVGLVRGRGSIRGGRALFLAAIVAGFELSYVVAYAAGRWHSPVIGFVVPFAALAVAPPADRRQWWRAALTSRAVWILAAVFFVVQLEYAYFVWRYA
jgi:4-amino-4-deoxy-L-arabinose transferase-like glycosyltransferase